MSKFSDRVRKWRDNNPPVVDELLAALELFPLPDDGNPVEWLYARWDDGTLPDGRYIFMDFLTCEA